VSAGFQCLTCLQDLWIEKFVKEEGLHDSLEAFTDCFGNLLLLLLQELSGGHCANLRYLPTSQWTGQK